MDVTDQRLLALLKKDGRASVTNLAGELGVSRVTVQSRLDRMKRDGTIRRFTVEMGRVGFDDLIHAIMMIEVKGAQSVSVIRQLRRMAEIVDLHTTNGVWDLVARIETVSLPDFDRVLRQVREVQGVTGSETSLLLDRARG
ncbi:Lrp/AsnC family transcriptional regulator [Litoreibacter janthinus]|uniref:DNA-binding transcriptional regulator, Lrp family n=1 Tax=Litoreibacter janthinus TaxID=670154 RepID=A0A1I6FV87_9RHOB|nr:Lrp/AsnC family transcriptional regulator [Litoreibacter janthinus]SFR33875.1 DNA-binding transcriptional regulator, Lrp family [Litoreibacter janthinus]